MRKVILYIWITISFFSCENMETVVDLDIPETPQVLVMNGVLDTDTTTRLLISHSVGAFSNEIPISINNAEVVLYENNILIDTLNVNMQNTISYYFNNGGGSFDSIPMSYYESNIIPSKNTNYRIEAMHPNYPNISADTFIPDDIEIYNIDVDTLTNDDKISFKFSFIDDINADNYYRLKLFSKCYKKWKNEFGEIEIYPLTRGYQEFASNDPSFPSNGIPWDGYTFSGRQVIFSDALFNGEEKNILIDIINEGYEYADCDTIALQFSVFSSDTYSYYNSLDNHRDKGPIGIFGGEVIPVYSNVENGLGSIISTNSQIIQIKP
tara:strand:+ start:145 stop:1113 length:969 start_codon:yes stop_codon:yes gene_type:complete